MKKSELREMIKEEAKRINESTELSFPEAIDEIDSIIQNTVDAMYTAANNNSKQAQWIGPAVQDLEDIQYTLKKIVKKRSKKITDKIWV